MRQEKKMNFLVLGSAGMAGNTIATYLAEKGHFVEGFSRSPTDQVPSIIGDATDSNLIEKVIKKGEYDAVINCIGILNQYAEADHAKAVFLNSYLPHQLVKLTKNMSTQVVHISTDCVFSGSRGGYTENDFPDGETFYDRTKALGEIVDSKNITFRNSIVGPDIKESGIGLLNWFMKQEGTIKGFTNAIWTGITTLELAKVIELFVAEKATGLFNMVHKESINKYDLLNLFNKHLRGGSINIQPFEGKMPNKSLIRTNFNFEYEVPDYETMVFEMANWIRIHKSKYPHYKL